MAVKFLRQGKPKEILEEEARTMAELKAAGLDVPGLVQDESAQSVWQYQGDLPKIPPQGILLDPSRTYISYITTPEYFRYPETIKNPDLMATLAKNSARQLALLLTKGYLHTSLCPMTHTTDRRSRPWMWTYEPIGGIEDLKSKMSYSNIRLEGLADFAHVRKVASADYLKYEVGEALSEWALVIAYHSLMNGISPEETLGILKDGLKEYFGVLGLKYTSRDTKLKQFMELFQMEIPNNEISSKGDTNHNQQKGRWINGIPTLDLFVEYIENILGRISKSQTYTRLLPSSLKIEEITNNNFTSFGNLHFYNGKIYFVYDRKKAIIMFDPTTKVSKVIATGISDNMSRSAVYEGKLYVIDYRSHAVIKIDLLTGAREKFTDGTRGVIIYNGKLYLQDGPGTVRTGNSSIIIEIDLKTKARRKIAEGITLNSGIVHSGMLYVQDNERKSIFMINLKTLTEEEFAQGKISTSFNMAFYQGKLYVPDYSNHAIFEINPKTGEIKELAKGILHSPHDLVIYKGIIYVSDQNMGIIRIEPKKGDWIELGRGSIDIPGMITVHEGKLYVLDNNDMVMMSLDKPSQPTAERSGPSKQGKDIAMSARLDTAMQVPKFTGPSERWQQDHALTVNGGIDLTRNRMHVSKQGQGVDLQFDPSMIARIKREGFDGLEFKIESIRPMANLTLILGLSPSKVKPRGPIKNI